MGPRPDPGPVDLHTHTIFSDGLFSPEELVAEAGNRNLSAVAITDHDSVGAIERAIAAGKQHGVEIVPGVEMSCNADGIDVHMLGYYLDYQAQDVLGFFENVRLHREERARKMIEKLEELDVKVPMERVMAAAQGGAVGRPHVAQAMVEAGAVPNVEQAFRRYISYEGPAYVPKMKLTPGEAIGFIKQHNGVAVIAHPATYRNDNAVYSAIAAGVDGIEVWHPDHGPRETSRYNEIAQKNRLLMTGGSDCHGGRKYNHVFLGEIPIPYRYLAALKCRSRAIRS